MFECTAETMLHSIKKITALPHNSLLFPGMCKLRPTYTCECTLQHFTGHEYAWMNIKFINSLQDSCLPSSNPERSDIEISVRYCYVCVCVVLYKCIFHPYVEEVSLGVSAVYKTNCCSKL